jgi:DNA polymerase (family X)
MFVRNPLNEDIYRLLNQIADLLEMQEASTFKVNAYRNAATEIARMPEDLKKTALKRDIKKLEAMPAIGHSIANLIIDYYQNGHSRYLNRLMGDVSFEQVIERIPGIGPELARRITRELNIDTLEELEQAVYDGRLDSVSGFGKARLHLIRMALEGLLSRRKPGKAWRSRFEFAPKIDAPPIDILLEIDKDYRRLAADNKLKKIAPRRFNPENESWLPIYHTDRKGWHFTVLFSNTARAHQLNKQFDWVIIYYQKENREGQVTVVTETKGPLAGMRVVRGWEEESEKYYGMPFLLESQAD